MRRLLLVTDGSWVANEIRSSLTLGNWDIEELHDPHLTTERVDESEAEAVVVDMQVGNMGGMALIKEIRQNFSEDRRPRTVLLLDRAADEFIGRRAGADATVIKPVTASELRKALGATGLQTRSSSL